MIYQGEPMDANRIVRVLIRDRARLLGYIWAIVRDPHLAADVYQDVPVLAIERGAEVKDDERLLLGSRKTARFKALEVLRERSRRIVALDDDVLDLLTAEWDAGG